MGNDEIAKALKDLWIELLDMQSRIRAIEKRFEKDETMIDEYICSQCKKEITINII